MAEIILPPEENEETPQAPELNIDKPTENSKVITIEFEAKKTNKVSTKDTNQQLYTTDTDAWFEFKETSLEGANGTYSVVFRNRHDGSIFQRTGDVVNGVAYYKIPEQEIRHAGAWRGQIVYTLENGDTTAREFDYDVKGHILDGKDVREIVVEDFETLMSQLNSMKDNAELELADLVNTAERNELERQQFYESLVEDINDLQENYQELLDTGVLQTNINEKLEELEEEYAPKLTEVTAQLAQKADTKYLETNLDKKRNKIEKLNLEDFSSEVLSAIEGGEGTEFNLLSIPQEKSVGVKETKYLMAEGRPSKNIFDGEVELGVFTFGSGEKHAVGDDRAYRNKNPIKVKKGSTITIQLFGGKNNDIQFLFQYDANMVFINYVPVGTPLKTIKLNENTEYINFRTETDGSNGYVLPSMGFFINNLQIEQGASPSPYESPFPKAIVSIDKGSIGREELATGVMSTDLSYIFKDESYWEQGSTNNTSTWDNSKTGTSLRIRTINTFRMFGEVTFTIPSGYRLAIKSHNYVTGAFESDPGWLTGKVTRNFEEFKNVGFNVAKVGDGAIVPTDIAGENWSSENEHDMGKVNDLVARLMKTMEEPATVVAPTYAEVLLLDMSPKMAGHKGYSGEAPENTLPAFEKAIEHGFWGGECDVQLTSDGEWILMHDTTVDRTTDGTGNVSSFTLAEIKELTVDAGSNVELYPNLKVPTLNEFLQLCKKHNLTPIIELKSHSNLPKLIDTIQGWGMERNSILMTYDRSVANTLRGLSEKIPIQLLVGGAPDEELVLSHIEFMKELGNNAGIHVNYLYLTKSMIRAAHKNDVFVNTYTLNDSEIAKTLISYGIDMITTDVLLDIS